MRQMVPLPEQEKAMMPGQHMGVTAGAGSGKTWVLTGRILRILKEAPPDGRATMLLRIVAVTFTNGAAGEIRDRVRKVVFETLENSTDEVERHSWLQVLERIPDARISTIHGLASRLLRQFAPDGEVDPGFTVDEMPGTDERTSADAYLAELLDPDWRGEDTGMETVEAAKALLARWDVWQIGRTLQAFDRRRDALEAWVTGSDYPQEACTRSWEPAGYELRESRGRLHRALVTDGPYREHVLKTASEVQRILAGPGFTGKGTTSLRKKGPQFLSTLIRFLMETDTDGHLFDALANHVRGLGSVNCEGKWFDSPESCETVRRFFDDVTGWLPPVEKAREEEWPDVLAEAALPGETPRQSIDRLYDEDRRHFATLAHGWIHWRRRRGRGVSILDFDDLEVEFERVLRENPAARKRIGESISHLLVDEFQDTSPLQWRFLRQVIDSLGPDADVFLVGDEKQSIYAFRRADVTVFGRALDDLHERNLSRKRRGPAGSTRHSLRKSFRASRNVLACINRIFSMAFPGEEALDFEPSRQELEPVDGQTDPGGVVEWIADADLRGRSRDVEQAELAALVSRLKSHFGNPLPERGGKKRTLGWGDCAVICRSHRQITAVEAALLEAGIPCRRRAEKGFYELPEVTDLVAALSVLHAPVTAADLLAFFLSPLAALPLDVPFAMSVAANPESRFVSLDPARRFDGWMREMDTSGGSSADLEFFCGYLFARGLACAAQRSRDVATAVWESRIAATVSGPAAGFERLLELTGGRAALAAGTGGPSRLANAEKFITLVYEKEYEGLDMGAMVESFRRLMELGEQAQEPSAPWGDSGDRVSLLTIHGAKGLEFEAVFLPFCGQATGGGSGDRQIYWEKAGSGIAPVFELPPAPGEEFLKPSAFLEARTAAEARDLAEQLRLFYVAATRAKRFLVFLSAGKGGGVQYLRYAFGPEARTEKMTRETGDFTVDILPLGSLSGGSGNGKPATWATIKARISEAEKAQPVDLFPAPASSRRRIILDFSSIRTFLDCELQYFYRHRLEIPPHRWFRPPQVEFVDTVLDALPANVRGTLLHKALELESVSGDFLDWVKLELVRQGLGDSSGVLKSVVDAADKAVKFQQKIISPWLSDAKEVRREWDFLARFSSTSGLDVDIRGAIDLVFDTGSGWVIVDYKSGRTGGQAGAEKKLREEKYDLQLAIYRWALGRTGLPVSATRIAWIDEGFVTDVNDLPGPEAVTAIIERCTRGILSGNYTGAFSVSGRGAVPSVCENCGYRAHGLCRDHIKE